MRRLLPVLLLVVIVAAVGGPPAGAATPERKHFYIPAADGTPLRACSISTPGGGPKPVILEWTSYAIDADYGGGFPAGCPPQFAALASEAAEAGFVFVAANTRGTGASGGDHQDVWSRTDAEDGAAVVEWLAAQPWSTGAVGLIGCSNSGAFANGVAAIAPPPLKAVMTDCAPLDVYRDAIYPGGLASYSLLFTSSRPVASQVTPGGVGEHVARGDASFIPRAALSSATQAEFISHRTEDEVWASRDLTAAAPFDVPTYYLGTWADYMLRGTTEFARVRKPSDRVLIMPGGHAANMAREGRYGTTERALAWFTFWLKRRGQGPDPFAAEPPIVFAELDGGRPADVVTGSWHWPLRRAEYRRWYLDTGATGTTASINDGSLTRQPPSASASTRYSYPNVSGASTSDHRQGGDAVPGGVRDSGDAASFTSAPLTQDVHVAGPITATIYASTTATETDWVVRLVDVAPDGTATDVTNGWLSSGFRALDRGRTLYSSGGDIIRPFHDHTTSKAVTSGEVLPYEVEVLPTANVFRAGHRIRVVVQSSAAPWFLQSIPPAVNTIVHGPETPSSILLPVLPRVPRPRG